MIDPPHKAYKRRAVELRASAARESPYDLDSSALLLFYATECALKYVYMLDNGLRSASDSRAGCISIKEMSHNLSRLLAHMKAPRSSFPPLPVVLLQRTGEQKDISEVHQAYRYGEKISATQAICDWMSAILNWCERN